MSREEWVEARRRFLEREKELTRARDALSAARRELPWLELDEGLHVRRSVGPSHTLAELFGGRSQLIVYHFMFGPDWEEGCPSCSFWADNFNGIPVHLAHRDTTFVAVSRARASSRSRPTRTRLGWSFPWYSSAGSEFNFDMGVSFEPTDGEPAPNYNFGTTDRSAARRRRVSASSTATRTGRVFLTYQTFARGLDMLNGAYNFLDLTPKGRDEDELPWPMAWLARDA